MSQINIFLNAKKKHPRIFDIMLSKRKKISMNLESDIYWMIIFFIKALKL
jgi:hypothetical protein